MIVSIKDSLKLFGIIIICFCGVFVCTFFLNYYLDVIPLKDTIPEEYISLYNAQVATAQFTSAITGGVLVLIAVIMIVFYIKLYIDGHSRQLGILKAMGYSRFKIALRFCVFGLSVFSGCAAGYVAGFAITPFIYKQLTIQGIPEVAINFHFSLLICLVFLPALVFGAISVAYAYKSLSRPVLNMIKGYSGKVKNKNGKPDKERPFLWEMCLKTLGGRKSLAFFIAFSCFCFSAMVQMGLSMERLASKAMGIMILAIGVVLAVTTMFMAVTSLVRGNIKNIAVMKAFGYSLKERSLAVLSGYVPFAVIGFGIGTAYQYGLLNLMLNVIFKNVGEVPEYTFNLPVFFITFAVFVVAYTAAMAAYSVVMDRVPVKEIMLEN